MTSKELHELVSNGTGNESNICQIVAIKNGKVAYSDSWRGFNSDDTTNVMSVTKGITALLTGIAIDKGFIKSADQKVLDFFPDYTVKRGEKTIYDVTIRHLLTMTAPYKYRSEPWTKVCTSPDWTLAALDLLGGRSGITGEFKYATLGIQIMAGIIQNASGTSLLDFANKELFEPLGIPAHKNHGASNKEDQFTYVMTKDPHPNEWYSDPTGTVTAGWGLTMSADSLARIGSMVLDDGCFDGRQIVSASWISEMTTPYLQLGERFGSMQYGYLWYKPHKDREVYAAIGDNGNIIYVNREEQVAVGITGTFKPMIFDRVEFIENNVLKVL